VSTRRVPYLVASAVVITALTLPTAVAAASVRRRSTDAVVTPRHRIVDNVRMRDSGELLVDVTARAPGVSWQRVGAESAVVRISVDGKLITDDVVMQSQPITRSFDLGTWHAGRHVVRFSFDAPASTKAAAEVILERVRYRTVPRGTNDFVIFSHSPVLYGRNVAGVAPDETGPYQNAVTDTPLVAWHEATPTPSGGMHLTYSVIWSNEDGGTSTPALMARWGRTTDIEWIYQVDVDARGRTVPGTGVFQSPGHGTAVFAGRYERNHPLLETCTLNNNVCDTIDDPMRFALATAEGLDPTTQAREQVMDANPWTYRIMAEEMFREHKVVKAPDPAQTTFIADPRDYVYLVVRKTTRAPNNGIFWVGVAIGVRLKSDSTRYRSDKGLHPDWSLQRDDPAATTVELPFGTRPSDIAEIDAIRVAFGPDTGASVKVNAVNRAFFLTRFELPARSFFSGATPATLTAASPVAVLYRSH
jgi:hypothetical protein